MDKLLRNIDQRLWRKVKSQAALDGLSMKDWVERVLAEKLKVKQSSARLSASPSGGAKRADTCALELVKALSDGEWHNTAYLSIDAGRSIRPEIAWRAAQRKARSQINDTGAAVGRGKVICVRRILDRWSKAGRLEKRKREDGRVEWRLATRDWIQPYLREALERRKKQK